MLFKEFQDCYYGHHLGYWNWTIQQFWISISPWCPLSSFGSAWCLKNFKMATDIVDNVMELFLAILNFCVTLMPPIKFQLNQTWGLGDVVWRISRCPPPHHHPRRPTWILEWNDFSNLESLCHYDASNQVSAQSDLGFRCRLKNFKILELNNFSNFESVSLSCLPSSFS